MKMKARILLATIAASALTASASITPFTETFESGDSNWAAASFGPATWNATGSMDNSAYISGSVDLNNAGPFGMTVLRGHADQNASGGAFVGDYLASGITTVEFDFRQNSGFDLDIALRIAGPANSPAIDIQTGGLVASGQWVHLSFDLFFGNPLMTLEGPPTPDFYNAVVSNVGNFQVSSFRPDGLTTPLMADFDLDNVQITPAPSGAAVLGLGCLAASRRRRS
jgi:hypothetical protein